MKTVLIITSSFLPLPPTKGGAVENLTQNIIDYNEKTPKVKFIAYSYGEIDTSNYCNYNNIEYRSIKKNCVFERISKLLRKITKGSFPEYFLYKIKKDLKKRNDSIDVALIENRPIYTIYTQENICNNVILHTHNEWYSESPRIIFDHCNKIITVSDYMKRKISEFCKEDKTKVIFNAVNDELLLGQVDETKIKAIRKKWKLSESDKIILFTGKLKNDKGAFELVKAFNEAKLSSNVKLILAGADADSREYAERLDSEICSNKNIIKTGYIDYSELANIYKMANLQIIPSQWDDPCPLTVIEGICFGLPQIVSDSGGIPEEVAEDGAIIIKRGKNFINELASTIKATINDESKLEKMANASKIKSKEYKNDLFCKSIIEELIK